MHTRSIKKHPYAGMNLLGSGQEAHVYTDGVSVFKVFIPSKNSITLESATAIMRSIAQKKTCNHFYSLSVSGNSTQNSPLVLKYLFEKSRPYSGGMAQDMISFLLEAREIGIVSRNVHPDNFIVTENGLLYIDYGRDMMPYSDDEFKHMAKRAWLSMLFWYREDLKDIMRKALQNSNLPELDGFDDYFKRLCAAGHCAQAFIPVPDYFSPMPQEKVLNPIIIQKILKYTPTKILDYGCGKGKIVEELAQHGVYCVAWDPNYNQIVQNKKNTKAVRYEHTLAACQDNNFDAVVCTLVLCLIPDEEVFNALSNIYYSLSNGGKLYLAICNPFFNGLKQSKYHYKQAKDDFAYSQHSGLPSVSQYSGTAFTEYHRPYEWYVRQLAKFGFIIEEQEESDGKNPKTGRDFSDYLVLVAKKHIISAKRVTLLIRACALDHETIKTQVCHLVRQLAITPYIKTILVQVDTREGNFTRSYGEPSLQKLLDELNIIKQQGIIDDIITTPRDLEQIRNLNYRWYNLDSLIECSAKKEPGITSLAGFEAAPDEYILAVDADIMLYKKQRHDPVKETIEILEQHENALSVSLNIAQHQDLPVTATNASNIAHRIEVRCAMFDKERLLKARPFPNSIENNFLSLPWHRALDRAIATGGCTSLRGGSCNSGFVHPPNTSKVPQKGWLSVLDRLEAGFVAASQYGNVDLVSTSDEWCGPKRHEPFVFIINGRNVSTDRLKRCINSLVRQNGPEWGAVVTDDASDDGSASYLEAICSNIAAKVTLIRNRVRYGQLANTYKSIKNYVANPQTVILTLDSDDALLGENALARVAAEYQKGADLTVGSMLRTDKPHKMYPVSFDNPRKNRGGNVWLHLRTFKKYLFDAIQEEDLKLNGEWVEVANDWAFMLPLVEMAKQPVFIPDLLYLYEPSDDKFLTKVTDPTHRENIIASIVAKTPYSVLR